MAEADAYRTYVASLEAIKRTSATKAEYWMARDLQPLLAYDRWENFDTTVQRARMACESAGGMPGHHFLASTKKVSLGSGAERAVSDYFLSRYACYLIAMNATPTKAEVGYAQTYFAVQTRRQETQDALTDEERRRELRQRVKDANKNLNSAAKQAGVQRYALFHDAGYKGLYGELGRDEIKAKKGIPSKDELLDCIGRAELAANEFRITQTEQKLARAGGVGEAVAIYTHKDIGRRVRKTIEQIGGIMPEELPAETSLKKLSGKKRDQLKPPQGNPKALTE